MGAERGGDHGKAHVFRRTGTSWAKAQELAPAEATAAFGYDLALSGDYAVVGSAGEAAFAFHVGLGEGVDCTSAEQCVRGVCASEGVCCDSDCAGGCESCLASRKASGPDGACGPIAAESDPRDACTSEATSSCGLTGACDGAGACAEYPVGSECDPASCPTPTSENPRDECDGSGACLATTVADCQLGYLCVAGACQTSCGSDADCDDSQGYVCGSGECKVPSAQPCSDDAECSSGHCSDGLCCDKACRGQCEACSEPAHEGICIAVTGEPRGTSRVACSADGDPACASRCDGVKRDACRYVPATESCACANGDAAFSCDGAGQCLTDAPVSCGGFACRDDACLQECDSDDDCSAGYGCVEASCVLSDPGARCSEDLSKSIGTEGSTLCSPFRCDAQVGACQKRCTNSQDCAERFACNSVRGTCEVAAQGSTDVAGCGCRAAGRHGGLGYGWLVAAGLCHVLVSRRRRARAEVSER